MSFRGAKRRGNLGKALPIYTECRRTQSLSNLTVAALSERHGGLQYAPHCLYGARLSDLSLRGAKRRGALSAKREEVPLGCNLGKALPNCTGHCRGADSRARRNAADSNGPPLKWQRLPDLSLRGRFAPVAISGRQLRFRREYPVIRLCTARLPRRFAPRNDKSEVRAILAMA